MSTACLRANSMASSGSANVVTSRLASRPLMISLRTIRPVDWSSMTKILSGASLASTESWTRVSGLDVFFMMVPLPGARICGPAGCSPHPRSHYTIFVAKLRAIPIRYFVLRHMDSLGGLFGGRERGFHLPAHPHRVAGSVKSHVRPMNWLSRLHGVQQLDPMRKPEGKRAQAQRIRGRHEAADHGESPFAVEHLPRP